MAPALWCAAMVVTLAVAAPAIAQDDDDAPVGDAAAPAGDTLVMNFRDATLDMILTHLSEEAGLIVVNDIELTTRIDVFSHTPVTIDEAVDLLNTVLLDSGHTAVRRDRVLRIVEVGDAAKMRVPVRVGADPQAIRETDTIITQVIPIRYADAANIAEDIRSLVSEDFAELSANESSNALIITDTEANIRRIVEIVQALDQSIQSVTAVRVFQLRYADAESTAELLEEVFVDDTPSEDELMARMMRNRFQRGGRGDDDQAEPSGRRGNRVIASADDRSNSVVVSTAPELMETIAAVIEDLDQDTSEKDSVFIYAVKYSESADLAAVFNDLFNGAQAADADDTGNRAGGGGNRRGAQVNTGDVAAGDLGAADLVGKVSAVASEQTNTLLVLTQEKNFPRVQEILTALDRAVPQVLIRVLVTEVSYDDSMDIGVEFAGINVGSDDETNIFTDFNLFESTLGLNFLLLDNTDFRLAIRALEGTGRFDVLSRPYLLTKDNQEASITVGQEVPFITDSRVTDDGGIVNTIDYRDVGIILNVTPQINEDGLVVLDVRQELSALTERTIPISEVFDAVIINQRAVETQVAVGDGQTVVIGGLMEDRLQENVSKVPLLGDIPLLGGFFKRTERSTTKTELLLFLTPEVVLDPTDLTPTTRRVQQEAHAIGNAVEPGLLLRHLERLEAQVKRPGDDARPGPDIEPPPTDPAATDPGATDPIPPADTLPE